MAFMRKSGEATLNAAIAAVEAQSRAEFVVVVRSFEVGTQRPTLVAPRLRAALRGLAGGGRGPRAHGGSRRACAIFTSVSTRPGPPAISFVVLTCDRYYDTLTVRIFAWGYDSSVHESNDDELVGGSRNEPRRYSEYWPR